MSADAPGAGARAAVDLYWLPLGAGGHFVRLNGRVYEALAARRGKRPRKDLYHSALVVNDGDGTFVIEQAWPIPGGDNRSRGVVAEGPVGTRRAGTLRFLRYEIRRWRDGVIADLDEAVESPLRLTDDRTVAERLLAIAPEVPTPVWGRDELGCRRDVELELADLVAGRARRPRHRRDPSAVGRSRARLGRRPGRRPARGGTGVVRPDCEGNLWAAKSVRWHGDDLAVSREGHVRRGRPDSELLVVDGAVYGQEAGDWIRQGSPENIDPDSGTTPAEYLAAVREDVGGATLRRITDGMTGLRTRRLADGATVYSGSVAASLIAKETGLKEGESIRVLPFGYVAHDRAANPDAALDTAVTVGADGVIRELAVNWGTWSYTVAYSGLGTTPALVAPANARDLVRERIARAR